MSGTVTNFSDATIADPIGVAAGPDCAIWFTSSGNNSIVSLVSEATIFTTVPSGGFPLRATTFLF